MRSAEQLPLSSKMAANRLRSTVDRSDPDNEEGGGGYWETCPHSCNTFTTSTALRRFATIPRTRATK